MVLKKIVSYWGRRPKRVVSIKEGDKYVYEPINPAATRNRGRQCIFIKQVEDAFFSDPDKNCEVRWLDTKRVGLTNINNLIHIDQYGKTGEELTLEAVEYIKAQENNLY